MDFYILRLKLCGIKNISEPIELFFYKKTINDDFSPDDYKIKAIYGENGSGKTAIITSVKLLKNLLVHRDYLSDSDTQRYLSELVNKKTKCGFIECEIRSTYRETAIYLYRVDFEIRDDGCFYISREELKKKIGDNSKKIFKPVFISENGTIKSINDDSSISKVKEKTMNLLERQTLVSSIPYFMFAGNTLTRTDTTNSILGMYMFGLTVFVFLDESDNHSNFAFMERIRDMQRDDFLNMGADSLHQISSKIFSINNSDQQINKSFLHAYQEKTDRLCRFIQIFKPELKSIRIEKKDFGEYYKCNLVMEYEDYSLDKEFESRGIKKLMELFDTLDYASYGFIAFIDELDSNINDVYLGKLIEFFEYYGNGQLCFTAHNLSPMSVIKNSSKSIDFISSINTVHTWKKCGNLSPENAYRNGFIEDSPFNVDSSNFLGILGGYDE